MALLRDEPEGAQLDERVTDLAQPCPVVVHDGRGRQHAVHHSGGQRSTLSQDLEGVCPVSVDVR